MSILGKGGKQRGIERHCQFLTSSEPDQLHRACRLFGPWTRPGEQRRTPRHAVSPPASSPSHIAQWQCKRPSTTRPTRFHVERVQHASRRELGQGVAADRNSRFPRPSVHGATVAHCGAGRTRKNRFPRTRSAPAEGGKHEVSGCVLSMALSTGLRLRDTAKMAITVKLPVPESRRLHGPHLPHPESRPVGHMRHKRHPSICRRCKLNQHSSQRIKCDHCPEIYPDRSS